MRFIETDPESGAKIYRLTDKPWPADNIYGEQPYSPPQGGRIAVCSYPQGSAAGASTLSILEIENGALHSVIDELPTIPAFHAWGEYLYFQQRVPNALLLKRVHFQTLEKEELITLPGEEGDYSYGTVAPDHRFYAVSVHRPESCRVLLFDLKNGDKHVLVENPAQYFKHEQFSRDGRNRILIQANDSVLKPSVINLGVIETGPPGIHWLPVDVPPSAPHAARPEGKRFTPRCSGHEAWIGRSDRVLLSSSYDETKNVSLWTAATGDPAPIAVCRTGPKTKFMHVSVSACGNFWIADAMREQDTPIYIGSFQSGNFKRLVYSRTISDGKQWSHTHPYMTADNRWLIYNSTQSGQAQVYGASVPEAFLKNLATESLNNGSREKRRISADHDGQERLCD